MATCWSQMAGPCLRNSKNVGAGELPQLLWYVKQSTTLTPNGTPMTPIKIEEGEEAEAMDIEPNTSGEAGVIHEKPIHVTVWGRLNSTSVPTVTSPQKCLRMIWIPISLLSTQRRLLCALSVPSALIIWILCRGTRRSTSRAFFKVDLG